jgi:hypothetical protein
VSEENAHAAQLRTLTTRFNRVVLTLLLGAASFAVLQHFFLNRLPSASVGDLLATALTISGISIPLVIAYLSLGRDHDLYRLVIEKIPHFLDQQKITKQGGVKSGITSKDVRGAYNYLMGRSSVRSGDSPTTRSSDSPTTNLIILYELIRFDFAPVETTMSADAKGKLLSPELCEIYDLYFEGKNDCLILRKYIWAIGIPAAACFLLLYARYFGADDWRIEIIEHFIISFTFFINAATYLFLLRIIHHRDKIHRESHRGTKLLCEAVPPEVEGAIRGEEELAQVMFSSVRPRGKGR